MLAKILGCLWMLLGVWWFLKPEALRNRLHKKMNRKMRFAIYGFILIFSVMMMASAFKAQGLFLKVVGILGMIIAIKVILLITSKTSEKMFEWLSQKPLIVFRIIALAFFLMGIGMYIDK